MYIFKLIFQFIIIIAALRTVLGKKPFNKVGRAIIYSKQLKYFQYVMIVFLTILGLTFGFLGGTEKVLQGEVLLGISVFMLMTIATLIFAFVHYKLEQ